MDIIEDEKEFMDILVDHYIDGKVSSEHVWYDDELEALYVVFSDC